MARPKGSTKTPTYRLHRASGQACVDIAGKTHYLGKYGSPASRAKFDRLVGQWLTAGRALPNGAGRAGEITVSELIAMYWEWFAKRMKPGNISHNGSPNIAKTRSPLRILRRLYGPTRAADFGPLAMTALRDEFTRTKVAAPGRGDELWSRGMCNIALKVVRLMFKWAVEYQLVEPSVYHGLRVVALLKEGDGGRETESVRPADPASVDAVLAIASPQTRAMIELLRITGMRAGELTSMRPCDIDMSQNPWEYRPASHKTKHRGRDRLIFLGPRCQAILQPHLRPEIADYVFKPSLGQWRGRSFAAGDKRVKKWPERYYTATLGKSLIMLRERAAKIAAKDGRPFEPWHLHQLRHGVATETRKKFGLDASRVLLGHADVQTTTIYAEVDAAHARKIMAEVG